MSTRTVRLDEGTEKILSSIVKKTGLSISTAIKKGLLSLQENLKTESSTTPYQIYSSINIGKGRSDIPSSAKTKLAVKKILLIKHSHSKKHI